MNQKRIEELKQKYYRGETSLEEEAELRELAEDEFLHEEFAYYDSSKQESLPIDFDERLEKLFEDEQSTAIKLWGVLRIAAAIVIGLLLGILYQGQKKEDIGMVKSALMVTLAEQQSVHLRLKALELAQYMPAIEGEFLTSLRDILDHDENINVRLEAFKVLAGFGNREITPLLVNSLFEQESLLVQGAIIKYLKAKNDPRLMERVLKDLNSRSMDDTKKTQIRNLINI